MTTPFRPEDCGSLLDLLPQGVILADPRGRFLRANPTACRILGLSPEDLPEAGLEDPRWILPRSGQGKALEPAVTLLEQAPSNPRRIGWSRHGGDTVWLEMAATRIRDGGFALAFQAPEVQETDLQRMVRLYNALSQINQAIIKIADRQTLMDQVCRVLVERAKFVLAWVGWDDPSTHRVSVVSQHGDATGYLERITVRSDDVPQGRGPTGKAIRLGTPQVLVNYDAEPDYAPWRAEAARAGFRSSAAFPIRRRGRVVAALCVHSPSPDFFGPQELTLLQEAAADLSFALDHLELESERRRSEERFAMAFHASPDAIVITRLSDMAILMVNEAFTRLMGHSAAEAVGRTAAELGLWDLMGDKDRMAAELRKPEAFVGREFRVRRADGSALDVMASSAPVMWEGVGARITVARDVTDLKQAERELRASEEKFFKVFHSAPIMIALSVLDEGTIVEVNEQFCRALGYQRWELVGSRTIDLGIVTAEERGRLVASLGQRVRNRELVLRARDGHAIPCLCSAERVDVGGVGLLLTMATDTTELKRAEEARRELQSEVAHMQRLESIGRLAGGIAHDMNNILGSIFAVAQTHLALAPEGGEAAKALATVELAASRGRDLVKGLLTLARKGLDVSAPLDVNVLIRQSADILGRTLMKKIRLELDLEEPLPPIVGEAGSLDSAIMNLCVNAVDAMGEGGTLTLRTRRAGRWIEVAVEDTGEGMTPEVLEKAMEPFFTTKPAGQGTGLGLATVFGTARAHGGTLTLKSAPGRGTQAILRLPCAEGPPEAPEAAAEPLPRGESLRILLVDDDELFRQTIPGMLGVLGHAVEVAAGGPEALARVDGGYAPDLVVLDLNMPDMGGLETLLGLRTRLPEVPVVLATGFLDPASAQALEGDGRLAILLKPFSMQEIQRAINRLWESRPVRT